MKLSDYVAQFLLEHGVEHVFGVTGGAVVHLFDSVQRLEGIEPVFNHHEQASALAAQAYARVRNGLGAAYFTTGPGGTNAITGVTAAWLDSVPVVYISGQTRLAHTTDGTTIRQYGNQQLNIVALVKPITKYAVMIEDPKTIRYHLEKAAAEAVSGRPGPVWIDIPLDVQWAEIEPSELPGYVKEEVKKTRFDQDSVKLEEIVSLLRSARRPLVLAGNGIHLAGAEEFFRKLVEQIGVPFVTSWNASDLIETDNSLCIGRPGIFGQRGANFAVQNCDLLLAIGSHLSVPLTGSMFEQFAPSAKVVVVDVDAAELNHKTVKVDYSLQMDAKVFLKKMLSSLPSFENPNQNEWITVCLNYKNAYNAIPAEWEENDKYVNPYVLMDMLSDEMDDSDVISVDGGGTTNQVAFQALRFKNGQRVAISAGLCSMGTGLPESIGLAFGSEGKKVVCLCGDGSIQFNIQELQTIVYHQLPIKVFVINNAGYLSIRQTQDGFLNSNYIGSEEKGGLSLPDLNAVAGAYGIQLHRIQNHENLREQIKMVLNSDGPVICEVMEDPRQEIIPRLGFDRQADGTGTPRPLEDMYPYLERSEFNSNMVREKVREKSRYVRN